ncbi:MAG: DMT family transporter [Akkermansiaceae bacterium]|nr:DMT family transporter [Akkermansiaceae bacterium]
MKYPPKISGTPATWQAPGITMSPVRRMDVPVSNQKPIMPLKTDDSLNYRSVILMLGSVILFATNVLLIRAIWLQTPAADGWLAMLFRGGVGLAVVFALFSKGRGLNPARLFKGRLITIRGVVGAASTVAFYITVLKLGAGRAVILNLTYPIFASMIAAFWLKEKMTRGAMLWMFVGFCGLVIFLSDDGKLMRPSAYDLLALTGAIGSGWVVVIIRRLRHEEHPATIYASQALYSLLIAAPAAVKLPTLPPSAWMLLALGAVIVTFAQLIMTQAYQSMTVSRGSSLQMLLPVATAAGGWMFFGETYLPLEIAGALVALFATWRVVVSR